MARMNHGSLRWLWGLPSACSGCEQKGPAQKAGEKVDKAVDQTGKALQKTGDQIQDAAKEAEKKAGESTK